MRPNKQARIMMDAEMASIWSTCYRLRVGCVLVDSYGIPLVIARNGVPTDVKHCSEYDYDVNERCIKCIHAEKNMINNAARKGVAIKNQELYVLYRPCISCANDIVQAGIAAVYYRWDYDTDESRYYVLNMFNEAQIFVRQLTMTTAEVSFHNTLEEWKKTWH